MRKEYRIEVDMGSGGYGFDDTFAELLEDVKNEYGTKIMEEVKKWALQANKGSQFHKYGMYITKY